MKQVFVEVGSLHHCNVRRFSKSSNAGRDSESSLAKSLASIAEVSLEAPLSSWPESSSRSSGVVTDLNRSRPPPRLNDGAGVAEDEARGVALSCLTSSDRGAAAAAS